MKGRATLFPSLQARNLEGRTFNLPEDFAGDLNIVLVAFERWHQAVVDSWLPAVETLMARHPRLALYEIPVLSSHYRLMRPFIDGGIAASLHHRARQRTLTAYTDRGRVVHALELPNHHTVAILLVDRQGRILWRSSGWYDPNEAAMLEHVLEVDPLTSIYYHWA